MFKYGILALPLAFSGLPMYVYAPDLYTTLHGVSLQSMGIFLLFIRLLDAVQDPLIGTLSDRWRAWRLRIIGGGLALLGLSVVMLYNPPGVAPMLPWFVVSMIGAAFAFSMVSINYNALGSLWSRAPREKTAIVAAREGIGLGGLLLATLTPAVLRLYLAPAAAYQAYTSIFVAVTLAAFMVFSRWRPHQAAKEDGKLPVEPAQLFDVRLIIRWPFAPLFLVYGLSTLASSIPGILVVFFVRDRLQAENFTGLFLAIYFIAGIVGMPLWKTLAARIGKRRCWMIAMVTGAVCFIGAYWLRAGDLAGYGAICFFSGLALGAELILPLSITSDLIDRTGQQARTSTIFAILLFISKLSLAIASGSAFLLLSRNGYVPGAPPLPQAGEALSVIYALVPSGLKLLAVVAALVLFRQSTPSTLKPSSA